MLRGALRRDEEWDVMVDLFMHRQFDEKKKIEGDAAETPDAPADDEAAEATNTLKKLRGDDDEADEDAEDEIDAGYE